MKLFKNISYILLFGLFSLHIHGADIVLSDTITTNFPKSGDKSLLININPIISFVGNMFNGSTNNGIYLSSATLVYRKYLDDKTSKRYRCNLGFNTENRVHNSNVNFPSLLFNGTRRDNNIQFSMGIGKEKRLPFHKFSLYTGWEFLAGISHSSTTYSYDYNQGDNIESPYSVFYLERMASSNVENGIHLGVAGILGADYHFSKVFYINVELSLPLVLNAELMSQPTFEELKVIDFQNIVEVKEVETEKPTFLWSASFNSNQFIQFRAGVVF